MFCCSVSFPAGPGPVGRQPFHRGHVPRAHPAVPAGHCQWAARNPAPLCQDLCSQSHLGVSKPWDRDRGGNHTEKLLCSSGVSVWAVGGFALNEIDVSLKSVSKQVQNRVTLMRNVELRFRVGYTKVLWWIWSQGGAALVVLESTRMKPRLFLFDHKGDCHHTGLWS